MEGLDRQDDENASVSLERGHFEPPSFVEDAMDGVDDQNFGEGVGADNPVGLRFLNLRSD